MSETNLRIRFKNKDLTNYVVAMRFTPIVGTLVYVVDDHAADPSEHTVLMVHRTARSDDDHLGKFNGLGGKLDKGEDVVAGARRELLEEADLDLLDVTLRGTIVWTGFGPSQEDWLGFIFVARPATTEVPTRNLEGELSWVKKSRLIQACEDDAHVRAQAELPMWEGDRLFVPLLFDENPAQFHGAMAYDGDTLLNWTYSR